MKLKLTLLSLLVAAANVVASDMIITAAEGAGNFNTTLQNVSVQTFDSIPLGKNNNVSWDGVGSFDHLNVINADQYGGAGGSKYAVEGLSGPNAVKTTTLSLNAPSSYFGLWWSAGDAANQLSFYKAGSLVANFTTANLINLLPSSYNGNPNSGYVHNQDAGEKFGFINFIGDANTSWDSIVFSNSAGSGFEADNYSSRVAAWNPVVDGTAPGTPFLELKDGVYTAINSIPANFNTPGAPAPSLIACLAFAAVLARRKTEI